MCQWYKKQPHLQVKNAAVKKKDIQREENKLWQNY